MKHIKIYEQFSNLKEEEIFSKIEKDEDVISDEKIENPHFEVESTDFISADDNSEGNYLISFENKKGEDTTIEVGGAVEPEFRGNSMISRIDMIPGSSSDGKEYLVTGWYNKAGNEGLPQYELVKVVIEEA